WPARTVDKRDVLIRLIRKGEQGEEHLKVLRALCQGERAFHATNHCVPVLQELELGDMTFAVHPYLGGQVDYPWFYDLSEVLDFIIQALEGIAYLHENLVAHLDIDIDNFLFNYAGQARYIEKFRCYFPVRYYLGDMELSVMFSPDSDPASRKIVGHPLTRIGVDPAKYGRELVPEMSNDEPYCPFRADMWQFGNMLGHMFEVGFSCSDIFFDQSTLSAIHRVLARPFHTDRRVEVHRTSGTSHGTAGDGTGYYSSRECPSTS
ncbi:hypothetical protein SISNIDRAFT_419173, partial [Sistotremastrum niveocremeum HHB9708]